MKTETLDRAVIEAKRFIRAASKTKPEIGYSGRISYSQNPGMDVAATKRASMDLSRALADLRGGK
jgi:hypothetical protein